MGEFLVVIYGAIACTMSLRLGFVFYRVDAQLAKVLAVVVWGGAIAGFITLLFSIASYFDIYSNLSAADMAVMRVIIFTGITGADIWALSVIKKIKNA